MLKDYKEQIQDADLVLVGIGRELRADRVIDFKKAITNEHYQISSIKKMKIPNG